MLKRIVRWTILVIVILAALAVAYAWRRDSADLAAYQKIARGNSAARVTSLLGQPRRISGAPENIAWDSEASIRPNRGECTQVFWYHPRLGIDGEMWAIGLDSQSKVISKYEYHSP
jgi:hypothetical protein